MNLIHTFQKAKVSKDFVQDCRDDFGFVKETEKTITMEFIPEDRGAFEAMIQSGQIGVPAIWKDYYPSNRTK
jgi:hypothetical protein